MKMSTRAILFTFLLFAFSACSGLSSVRNPVVPHSKVPFLKAVPTVTPTPNFTQASVQAKLELVTEGLPSALQIVPAPDDTGRLFILGKEGAIQIVQNGKLNPEPFLDLRSKVASKNEQGLQGMVFARDFATSKQFYIFYNRLPGSKLVLERYRVSSNPNAADKSTRTKILSIRHPSDRHNGGQLYFGQDGYLYVAVGDGSDIKKPFSTNAQRLDTLLGKLLRIDVSTTPYSIPPDNPFVNDPAALPEIYAYGLRNPWRFTVDSATGNLFLVDVGEKSYEEVNVLPLADAAGKNFGWPRMEGAHCFSPKENCQDSTLQIPAYELAHPYGCAIVGGTVYHGAKFPALSGKYLFGDHCFGSLWSLAQTDTGAWQAQSLGILDIRIGAIVEAPDENIYLLDYGKGRLFRLTLE